MTTRAEITPYFTNYSLRVTTVTVLSERNVETRQIKAVTGHRSDTSIESYCERPTLRQFRNMLTAFSSFGRELAQTDVPAICPPPLPPSGPQNAVAPVCPSVAMQQSYLSRQQENFLVENGVNPGASLPSGSFQNCSFTFNMNISDSHDWLGCRTANILLFEWSSVESVPPWWFFVVSTAPGSFRFNSKYSAPSAVATSLKIDFFIAAWFSLPRLQKYKEINSHAVCIRARGTWVEASTSSTFLYNLWMTSALIDSLCTVPAISPVLDRCFR